MDDGEIVGALTRHLAAHPDNRARLLTDPVRMDNVAADIAYDDAALRNALRAITGLRVERAFLGGDRPTPEVLGELAHRLIHQQGIRDDAARRGLGLLDAACFGPRPAAHLQSAPPPLGMPPTQLGMPPAQLGELRAPLGAPTLTGPPAPTSAPTSTPTPPVIAPRPAPGSATPVAPGHPFPAGSPMPQQPLQPGLPTHNGAPAGRPRGRRTPVIAIAAGVGVLALGAVAASVLTRGPSVGPVTGLVADTAATPGSIVLRWKAVDGAGGYEVCREDRPCEQVSATTFTDTPKEATSHTYSVRARAGSALGSAATVAAAPVGGSALGPIERDLVAGMSDTLVNKASCKRVTTTAAGVTGGVSCDVATKSTGGAGSVWALQFETRAALERVYADDTPGPDTPSCPSSTSTTWHFSDTPTTEVGNIACYLTTGADKKAVVAWTYWGRRVVMYGISEGDDTDAVYSWWRSADIPSD